MTALTAGPGSPAPASSPVPGSRGGRRRGRGHRAGTGERVLHWFTWLVIGWLALPIAVVIMFSFNNPHGRYNYSWTGFTLKYWGPRLFQIPALTSALEHSLEVATAATAGATVLGTLAGLALGKYRFRGQGASNLVQFACIAAPAVVMGSSLATFFLQLRIREGEVTVIIAHIMFCLSFVAITVRARVLTLDPSVEEAARDLGASAWETFRLVTLPMIMPGVVSGALLAFAMSVDDFIVTSFTSGSFMTFPLWIWSVSRQGLPPQVNVMGAIIFMTGVLLAVASALTGRRRRLPAPAAGRKPSAITGSPSAETPEPKRSQSGRLPGAGGPGPGPVRAEVTDVADSHDHRQQEHIEEDQVMPAVEEDQQIQPVSEEPHAEQAVVPAGPPVPPAPGRRHDQQGDSSQDQEKDIEVENSVSFTNVMISLDFPASDPDRAY